MKMQPQSNLNGKSRSTLELSNALIWPLMFSPNNSCFALNNWRTRSFRMNYQLLVELTIVLEF